ncbi:hypothetical protein [Paenibacillus alba]|uniref:Uncharacterized protein n=1 Tax=Paenibacillus alba TaxID=1197127 RepID=A0ABU6GAF3_9BACL|nr:hypothetical protein [Paenibacillus alba]MEC0231169.1 hypothetical protein [Paenibacillus alba]
MNLSELSEIQCPIAKKYIIQLLQRMEKLEQKQQPTPAIGFHMKEGEKQIETASKNVKYNLYD